VTNSEGDDAVKADSGGYDDRMIASATGALDVVRAASRTVDVDAALREDRLFALDAFDEWPDGHNVFNLGERSLGAFNGTVDERRDRPLLVVGNIAGEIEVMGERSARKARYDNDDSVLKRTDTVLNVLDEAAVAETFAAFYAWAADQVVRIRGEGGDRWVELVDGPSGTTGVERPLSVTTGRPPCSERTN
jgi:hypothetical protein